jgi:hypothetical protein
LVRGRRRQNCSNRHALRAHRTGMILCHRQQERLDRLIAAIVPMLAIWSLIVVYASAQQVSLAIASTPQFDVNSSNCHGSAAHGPTPIRLTVPLLILARSNATIPLTLSHTHTHHHHHHHQPPRTITTWQCPPYAHTHDTHTHTHACTHTRHAQAHAHAHAHTRACTRAATRLDYVRIESVHSSPQWPHG